MKWQGLMPVSYSYTCAGKKQFWKTQRSLGLIVVNAFDKYVIQTYEIDAQSTITNGYRNQPCQSFVIVFGYKFGALKISKQKETENFLHTPPTQ